MAIDDIPDIVLLDRAKCALLASIKSLHTLPFIDELQDLFVDHMPNDLSDFGVVDRDKDHSKYYCWASVLPGSNIETNVLIKAPTAGKTRVILYTGPEEMDSSRLVDVIVAVRHERFVAA